jgi:antitoxin CptB
MGNEPLNVNQLKWRCRRGIKEVELLLIPYFDSYFSQLSTTGQKCFTEILKEDDVVLFEWFTQRAEPTDPQMAKLVHAMITKTFCDL